MRRKSYVMLAAVVAGLLLGVAIGPAVRGLDASAQTPTQTPTPSQAPAQTAPAGSSLWNSFLDNLAAELNVQRSALDSAIVGAGTSTADEAVQQGTLTQPQADALKARLQAGDLGALLGGRGGFKGGRGPGGGVQQAIVDAAAQALGITADELRTQLRGGQTLAQIAQANNTTEQAVISAALAAAKTHLDQQVTAGTITQAQADAIYAELQTRGADLLTPRGRGGHGGQRGTPATPSASPSPSANSNA